MIVEWIISDDELIAVWNTDSQGIELMRKILAQTLLQCACDMYTGHSSREVARKLNLISPEKWELTKKGKEYLFAAYTQK